MRMQAARQHPQLLTLWMKVSLSTCSVSFRQSLPICSWPVWRCWRRRLEEDGAQAKPAQRQAAGRLEHRRLTLSATDLHSGGPVAFQKKIGLRQRAYMPEVSTHESAAGHTGGYLISRKEQHTDPLCSHVERSPARMHSTSGAPPLPITSS